MMTNSLYSLPGPTAVESRLECTLRLHSLASRGTSGERVGERGNPTKLSSSPRPSPPPSSEEREKAASVSDAGFPNLRAAFPPSPHFCVVGRWQSLAHLHGFPSSSSTLSTSVSDA